VITDCLEGAGIRISMDGRGRALDNIFIKRLWRSFKYEDIYLKDYASIAELEARLCAYFQFYNTERPPSEPGLSHPGGGALCLKTLKRWQCI
jgi:putative transposase